MAGDTACAASGVGERMAGARRADSVPYDACSVGTVSVAPDARVSVPA